MLTIIGLGISFDITLEGLKAARESDTAYLEEYTMPIEEEKLTALQEELGRAPIRLPREKVESDFLIKEAAEKNIALLVGGDPLSATTHISLIIDAKKQKIPVRIIHNSSILSSAMGKSGLQP
jgi:diphthine synthase